MTGKSLKQILREGAKQDAAWGEHHNPLRRAYESLFDMMEDYRADHPDASDDECFEAVCFGRRAEKEKSRECL